MAIATGKDGAVTLSGTAMARIRSWTLNFTADKEDTSVLGDDWHSFTQILTGATGTATATREVATTQNVIVDMFASGGSLSSVTIDLQEASGAVFSGTALIDSVDVGATVDAVQTFSFGFTVNSKPPYSG